MRLRIPALGVPQPRHAWRARQPGSQGDSLTIPPRCGPGSIGGPAMAGMLYKHHERREGLDARWMTQTLGAGSYWQKIWFPILWQLVPFEPNVWFPNWVQELPRLAVLDPTKPGDPASGGGSG